MDIVAARVSESGSVIFLASLNLTLATIGRVFVSLMSGRKPSIKLIDSIDSDQNDSKGRGNTRVSSSNGKRLTSKRLDNTLKAEEVSDGILYEPRVCIIRECFHKLACMLLEPNWRKN